MAEEAFEWAGFWRKVVYKLEIVNGIECIASDGRSEVTNYNPLKVEELSKRPTNPEENESSPEIALARLDTNDKQEILRFVNNFGLLGLWNHPYYCQAGNLDDIGDRSLMSGTRYSNWYRHPKKNNIYSWMEPLDMFVSATRDYQEFLNNVEIVESSDDKDGVVSFPVNHYWREQLKYVNIAPVWNTERWTLGWEYRSLLSALYLKVALEKQSGKLIRRCRKKRCGKLFIADNPENGFCSENCKIAFYTDSSRKKAMKDEFLNKYGNFINKKILLSFIDELLENGINGRNKIEKEIINELMDKRSNTE